jgi:hypothetical protein
MCEVVLGNSKEVHHPYFIDKLDLPFNSVKSCGRRGPAYNHTITLPNGVKIPLGKVIDYNEGIVDRNKNKGQDYNEYIVYNTSQIRIRYVVHVKRMDPNMDVN